MIKVRCLKINVIYLHMSHVATQLFWAYDSTNKASFNEACVFSRFWWGLRGGGCGFRYPGIQVSEFQSFAGDPIREKQGTRFVSKKSTFAMGKGRFDVFDVWVFVGTGKVRVQKLLCIFLVP